MAPRRRDDDIYEFFNDEALKRADELVSSLSSHLGLERRGQTTFYQGAISDMGQAANRFVKVTVADSGKTEDRLVIISEQPLAATRQALLVYRAGPGDDLKYMGILHDSRQGQRQEDEEAPRHFADYTIVRDVRKHPSSRG